MNFCVESLNRLGGQFVNFAGPMLWQSSLLIALVFAMDLALAGRIRAAVRHALWLVVLVKLLLPPTLALPTGAAWWFFPARSAVKAPAYYNYVVADEDITPPPTLAPPTVPIAAPPPALDLAGGIMLGAGAISLGLLSWLLLRWRQVVGVAQGIEAGNEFSGPLEAVRRLAGLRAPLRLSLVAQPMSPAVCGLFRPVILLPRMLAEKLTAGQLQAVLLHEAIHLRRRDIWVNCAQALLQVLYWWHPLVWLANARIRYVREEAVDDAVMLALAGEADLYAPTLLAVARLAFHRPLLSLGLVGILESRSALRQRIERLMDFRPPRRAGLTLASLCGIVVFSAVALPMGEGPAPAERDAVPAPVLAVAPPPAPATMAQSNPPAVLVQAEIYQRPARGSKRIVSVGHLTPDDFARFQSTLKKSGLTPLSQPRILTTTGKQAGFFAGDQQQSTEFDCLPVVHGGQVDLTLSGEIVERSAAGAMTNRFEANTTVRDHESAGLDSEDATSSLVVLVSVEIITNPAARLPQRLAPSRSALEATTNETSHSVPALLGTNQAGKLNLRFPSVSFIGLPLEDVLRQLNEAVKQNDPDHTGITISTATNSAMPRWEDINSVVVNIPLLSDVRLVDILNAIVLVAKPPVQYSVRDNAVIFAARAPYSDGHNLAVRTFKINTNTFLASLRSQNIVLAPAIPSTMSNPVNEFSVLQKMFGDAGVDWESPPGKAMFYKDRMGLMLVKATESDLTKIEAVLQKFDNQSSSAPIPLIHLKARFYEVPEKTAGRFEAIPGVTNGIATVLSPENTRALLQTIRSIRGAEALAEPEATVVSGRRTRMMATTVLTVVTNMLFLEFSANRVTTNYLAHPAKHLARQEMMLVTNASQVGAISPQCSQLECGPELEVVPQVLGDPARIQLAATASDVEFYGYAGPHKNFFGVIESGWPSHYATNSTGDKITLPAILPVQQMNRAAANVIVADGGSLVLFPAADSQPDWRRAQHIAQYEKKNGRKIMIVLVTPELVDSTGNRVEPDAVVHEAHL